MAVPRIVQEQRSLGTEHLELVSIREPETTVELGDHVAGELERAGKDGVHAALPDAGAVDACGLAGHQRDPLTQ